MKHLRLENMVRGWFVGSFTPTAHDTEACEVAVKQYKAGEHEDTHFHKIGTEITVILSGRVRMMGKEFGPNDIITLDPGEATSFDALTDVTLVVAKVPGARNDKYMA